MTKPIAVNLSFDMGSIEEVVAAQGGCEHTYDMHVNQLEHTRRLSAAVDKHRELLLQYIGSSSGGLDVEDLKELFVDSAQALVEVAEIIPIMGAMEATLQQMEAYGISIEIRLPSTS